MEGPFFYVGHHQTAHRGCVTKSTLQRAQGLTYDMVTAPITSKAYNRRVLAELSNHQRSLENRPLLTSSSGASIAVPHPTISPLSSEDTDLAPGEVISQLVCTTSSWIDLASHDPLIADVSRQVLRQEMAYASFCGASHIVIEGPRTHGAGNLSHEGLTQFARGVQEALRLTPYAQVHIRLSIIPPARLEAADPDLVDLGSFARRQTLVGRDIDDSLIVDHLTSWDVWHLIRSVCRYNPRLSIALVMSPRLPRLEVQARWFSEPVRILDIPGSSFVTNKHDIHVLPKTHQQFIARMMRLRITPWILLSDVGPLPEDSQEASETHDPTPAQAAAQKPGGKYKSDMPFIEYIRKHVQTKQPPRTPIERFGQGFQDYLQNPLQPLTDNLESITYEVFEKDPVKYDWYEAAITQALTDWAAYGKPKSKSDRVTLAVVGAGRGPLVTRALAASDVAEVPIDIWAIEKNPSAFVLLQRHNKEKWGGRVHLVQTDMRTWPGPTSDAAEAASIIKENVDGEAEQAQAGHNKPNAHTTIDILVSELLGSFGDNELSPECLDGVQHLLTPVHGISIPSSYTAHLTPISAPKLHADIGQRLAGGDEDAWEVPYVVMLHSIDYLSKQNSETTVSGPAIGEEQQLQDKQPNVKLAWEFAHPLPIEHIRNSQLNDSMGGNGHNARFTKLHFRCTDRGICHGLAGYFETVLYSPRSLGASEVGPENVVELSTNPVTMAEKSEDMISWFPIFFPLETPIYVPDDGELHVSMWRQTDGRKVWYEWIVEAFATVGTAASGLRRLRLGVSKLHSSAKNGCLM